MDELEDQVDLQSNKITLLEANLDDQEAKLVALRSSVAKSGRKMSLFGGGSMAKGGRKMSSLLGGDGRKMSLFGTTGRKMSTFLGHHEDESKDDGDTFAQLPEQKDEDNFPKSPLARIDSSPPLGVPSSSSPPLSLAVETSMPAAGLGSPSSLRKLSLFSPQARRGTRYAGSPGSPKQVPLDSLQKQVDHLEAELARITEKQKETHDAKVAALESQVMNLEKLVKGAMGVHTQETNVTGDMDTEETDVIPISLPHAHRFSRS